MEVYVVRGGEKSGPHSFFRMKELLEEGEIDGATLGWMQGEDSWKPLREIPAVLNLIQGLEREKLDAKLRSEPGPTVAPEPAVPPQRLPSHAFARFGARMLDLLMVQIVVGILWTVPEAPAGFQEMESFSDLWDFAKRGPTEEEAEYTQKVLYLKFGSIYAWHVLEIFLIAAFGTTPGKLLFRLRVVGPDGNRPGLGRSFFRSFLVLVTGMGAGFEPIQWIANFFAFLRVQNRGVALWDQQVHTQVRQLPMDNVRLLLILGIFMALVASRYVG